MGAALLHGDLPAAYTSNPVALIILVLLAALALLWAIDVLGGPAARLPRRVTTRLKAVPGVAWALLTLLLAVVYTLLRNLG